ncbi:heavy metal translocating P-type ATPase [Serpentinicella sp. ANB-PHB4]|uniref:heavy metal translocating P-type ATPase n=1 Tax=Serpentinicella sp. ANB-PHB4 TaxID=3074076 RepID=UPI00285E65F3|nr:heavy metal translocating P-type ATPase [Serpentinicella sp. ANB-PHB4]MDR5658424.1 heavy metal translocating P-type ATPase [Serpentinicella sp. ANB-PHB4]
MSVDIKLKKELILEGLDCANCATKIESEVNKIDGVVASVNFITKTLTVEVDNNINLDGILVTVNAIVNRHEPHVVIKEKKITKGEKKSLVLVGLGCANCATKIESQIKNLAGVKKASVDFVSRKLMIEANNKSDLKRIVEEAEVIIKKIEPDVKVIAVEENLNKENDHEVNNNKNELIKLAVGGTLFGIGLILDLSSSLNLMIFLLSYMIVGGEIVLKATNNIRRGQVFDENFLMSIATIGAFIIGEYPEGVAVMLFYKVGAFFQDLAVNRSRRSISALMDIRPDFARVINNGEENQVSPEDVNVGDMIIVKPGEKVPLDGKVVEGNSMIDTSALTGESIPREVLTGDDVLSGCINQNGVLVIEVTKEFSQSTVSKILDLVQNAASRKAPTENFITKFSRYYTPIVVGIAVVLATLPPLILQGATFSEWVYRALVFLVISCPCALVVSIPLGFFGGIGAASKRGILVKGSNYLEALNNVETIVFDKTGTLTKGVFNVTEINPMRNYTKEGLLKYAAYGESYSNHPIATSILKAYGKDVDKRKIEAYEEIPGHGVKVKIEGDEILVGNIKLMHRENIVFKELESTGTQVHVALNKVYAGNIVIADEVKKDSEHAIKELKNLAVKNRVMLTGDTNAVAQKIGKQLGINNVFAELLPTEKVEKLELLYKSVKGKLVFVGDGINDAPVLARADIGVAMGGLGSDAAIEAADIVIMTDEPSKIATAIKIARRTRKIVWQNIVFAMGVKILFLALGALGVASLWEAVFADVGVSVIAVLNAMRVMRPD